MRFYKYRRIISYIGKVMKYDRKEQKKVCGRLIIKHFLHYETQN